MRIITKLFIKHFIIQALWFGVFMYGLMGIMDGYTVKGLIIWSIYGVVMGLFFVFMQYRSVKESGITDFSDENLLHYDEYTFPGNTDWKTLKTRYKSDDQLEIKSEDQDSFRLKHKVYGRTWIEKFEFSRTYDDAKERIVVKYNPRFLHNLNFVSHREMMYNLAQVGGVDNITKESTDHTIFHPRLTVSL